MPRRVLRVLLVVAICLGVVGCRPHDTDYSLDLDDGAFAGPGTAGLSVVGQRVKGIVVYLHGADQNARVIRDSEKHRNVLDPLLRLGYAIVAADAQGNAYANPASVEDYRRLIVAAKDKYGAVPLYFVAESMGALAALTLIREDSARDIKAMVGISPLMGLPSEVRAVSFVNGPWQGHIPTAADPLSWPPEAFGDRAFRLYTSPEDKIIPENASALAFADRFGRVARVKVVECKGGHAASDCYRGADVAAWFEKLK